MAIDPIKKLSGKKNECSPVIKVEGVCYKCNRKLDWRVWNPDTYWDEVQAKYNTCDDCYPSIEYQKCRTCCNPDTVTVVLSGYGPDPFCSVYNGIYNLARVPSKSFLWTFYRTYPYPIVVSLQCKNDNWVIETLSWFSHDGHLNTNAPFRCSGGEVSGTAEMVTKSIGVTCSDTITATVSSP